MRKLSPRRVVAAFVAIVAVAFLSSSAAAATTRSGHSRPAQVVVTGQVQHRRAYTVADLRRFPQHTVTVRFGSSTGTERHTFTGPLLINVARPPAPGSTRTSRTTSCDSSSRRPAPTAIGRSCPGERSIRPSAHVRCWSPPPRTVSRWTPTALAWSCRVTPRAVVMSARSYSSTSATPIASSAGTEERGNR